MLLQSKVEVSNSGGSALLQDNFCLATTEERDIQEAIAASMRDTLDSPIMTETKLSLNNWTSPDNKSDHHVDEIRIKGCQNKPLKSTAMTEMGLSFNGLTSPEGEWVMSNDINLKENSS